MRTIRLTKSVNHFFLITKMLKGCFCPLLSNVKVFNAAVVAVLLCSRTSINESSEIPEDDRLCPATTISLPLVFMSVLLPPLDQHPFNFWYYGGLGRKRSWPKREYIRKSVINTGITFVRVKRGHKMIVASRWKEKKTASGGEIIFIHQLPKVTFCRKQDNLG